MTGEVLTGTGQVALASFLGWGVRLGSVPGVLV